jgi:hypothetical protein
VEGKCCIKDASIIAAPKQPLEASLTTATDFGNIGRDVDLQIPVAPPILCEIPGTVYKIYAIQNCEINEAHLTILYNNYLVF